MPTTLKRKETSKEILNISRDTKVDLKLKQRFSPLQISSSLRKLNIFYGTDDRIGFIIKLMEKGLKDSSYHNAITSELTTLSKDLEYFLTQSEVNKQLIEKTLKTIKQLLSSPYPKFYPEVIVLLKQLRVNLFAFEDNLLKILNDQLKLLLQEFPELYPDVPIEYDFKDEQIALKWDLEEFADMFSISYDLLIALEAHDSKKAKEQLKKLNEYLRIEPDTNEKNIVGYAKYIILLFMDAKGKDVLKAKEIIKIAVVFQILIRYFIIRFRIEYPGNTERVNARLEYHRS